MSIGLYTDYECAAEYLGGIFHLGLEVARQLVCGDGNDGGDELCSTGELNYYNDACDDR